MPVWHTSASEGGSRSHHVPLWHASAIEEGAGANVGALDGRQMPGWHTTARELLIAPRLSPPIGR